jgi:hypothetical protein
MSINNGVAMAVQCESAVLSADISKYSCVVSQKQIEHRKKNHYFVVSVELSQE